MRRPVFSPRQTTQSLALMDERAMPPFTFEEPRGVIGRVFWGILLALAAALGALAVPGLRRITIR